MTNIRALGWAAILLIACPLEVSAQAGWIFEEGTTTPVPLAEVSWRPADRDTWTERVQADLGGRFDVPGSWSGEGSIEVRALGYRSIELSVAEAVELHWQISIAADPLELETVIVTASGRSQRRSTIAVPIVAVDANEIQTSGAPSAVELLEEIPGIQAVSGVPSGSNLQIRGIGDARVLILIDGQPAAGSLIENRDLSRISLSAVERVEVVKGPLSSLYGSDALGGVINVITRDPNPGLQASARVSSAGRGRYSADGTVTGGGAVRTRTTLGWRQQQEVPGLDDTNAFARVWDLRSTVRYGRGGPFSIRADANVMRERQRWPTGGGFNGFNDNRGITAWTEGAWARGSGVFSIRLFGQDYEHLFRQSQGLAPIAGADEDAQHERLWKATAGYAWLSDRHALDVGVEVATRSIESPDKILQDRAEDDQFEFFAQDAWTIGMSTVSGGFRATMNDRWGNTVSPTIGVSLLPSSSLRFTGTVGRGFRAPSFKELAWDFANLGAGYTVQGYADLEPERSWNATAGFDWTPSPTLLIGVEGYTNRISNLIETVFTGNNPSGLLVYSPRNLSRARTRGVEARTVLRSGLWVARLEYALLDARTLEDDLPLDRRARHSGRVRVTRGLALGPDALVGTTLAWTGDAPLTGLTDQGVLAVVGTQARLIRLDVDLAVELPRELRLIMGVDNVFDSRPEGWQGILERRARIGIEARSLIGR
ncbi:MAG: TonB-dependent receptor [Gemmatimonadota bacterium]